MLEYVNPVGGQVSPTARNDVGAAHIGFFVDDIAALRSLLVARGVEFADLPAASPDAENPPVQKAYYVQDPDGNWLEFSEQAPAPAAS